MKILSRYILREVAWPCVLAFVVICFVGAASEFRERSSELNLDFLRVSDIGRLAIYFIPTIFSYILPITFMMGILLAFGGFAQSSELIAMRAAGIPLKRLIAPVLVMGALLSGISFYLLAEVQPWAVKRADQLIMQELVLRGTMDALPPGKMHDFDTGKDGTFRVYFAEKDAQTNTLRDIDIFISEGDGFVGLWHAESARVYYVDGVPDIELTNLTVIQPNNDGLIAAFSGHRTRTGPELFAEAPAPSRDALTLRQLFAEERSFVEAGRMSRSNATGSLKSTREEIGQRISLPLACLAVCLCAAPLAARGGRQGRSFSFFIGLSTGLAYFLLMQLFEASSERSMSETLLRALAPNVVLALFGVFFLWRVDRV